jgi:RHS repeat-associated protein
VTRQYGASDPELTTRFERDAAGRAYRVHYPAPDGIDVQVEYGYDGPYVTSVSDITGGVSRPLWHLVQADQGYRIGQEAFDAVGGSTAYQYESLTGRVYDAWTRDADGDTVQRMLQAYYYDGSVMQRAVDRAGKDRESYVYGYDELNRLTSMSLDDGGGTDEFIYGYDEIGNITTKPGMGVYTYDPSRPHLAVSAGSHAYSYDTRGNLTSRSGPSVPGEQQAFEYTSFDLPSAVTTGTTAPVTTHLEYDADQTRVMKWTEASRTYYAGDLYRRTVDEATGQVEHRYLVYVGARQVAEMVRLDGESLPSTTYALYDDRLGSATTVSDGDNAFYRDYAPFGELRTGTFDAGGVVTGFTGHNHDDELGLIDMKGRVYDPSAGRFLSADPILDAMHSQGINPYSYVWNDPVNLTDPSGFIAWSSDEALFAFMAGATAIVGAGLGISYLGQSAGSILPALASGGASGLGSGAYDWAAKAAGSTGEEQVLGRVPYDEPPPRNNGIDPEAHVDPERVPPAGPYDPKRSTLAGAEYAISLALFGRYFMPNLAIQYALDFWDVSVTQAYYDDTLKDFASTGHDVYYSHARGRLVDDVTIRIGPKAMTSARQLLSTSAHEGVHTEQIAGQRFAPKGDPVGRARNEVEAWTRERGLSERLNLPKEDIDYLERGIRYWEGEAR